ncbi:ABC transporter permease [Niallia nealsonii]|uniref:ABC transporter permease n=1 Tax=Niallia nealsonii TaxID=115979 RepID=A0A2N0Z7J3_9BACI|nr:ABC transporter permease [Niallia nealsonii]PKG25489.1 ABC transporter permease [Niallia nealsonii]
MFFQLIKKELLVIWRRPRELIVLLLMPFILITILGSALGAFNDGDVKVDAKLAVLLKDDPQLAQDKIIKEIQNTALSNEEKAQKIALISAFHPVDIFLNEVIETKELKKVLKVTVIEKTLSPKEQKKYDGILEIPVSFSEEFYQKLLNEKGEGGKWELAVADNTSVNATVIQDIVTSFEKEINLAKTAQQLQVDYAKIVSGQNKVATIENITKKKEIDAFSYYAVGMCVMFVFYVATTVSGFAYQQKEDHMYERILLASVSPFAYFAGIFAATFLLSFVQLNLLFSLTALFYGVAFPNIMYYLCVTIALNCMTASFAVFITAISYITNSKNIESLFSSLIVPIIAFVGGSFFDLSAIGGFMERLGEVSPGGAALTAYLKVIQGFSLYDMAEQFQAIFLFTGVLLFVTMMLIRKRGAAI